MAKGLTVLSRLVTETLSGQSRARYTMKTALQAIAFKSQTHPKHQFENLYGLLNSDLLIQSWGQINKRSAAGVDGITAIHYRPKLAENIERLTEQLKSKRYRVDDVKRINIPKSNGKTRALGLPTLNDKIVQQSVSQILQSIWESEFLCNNYGYRPNKSAHQAVHSLTLNLQFKGYGYIVEADIKGFFDNMSHDWLMKMLKLKIKHQAILNLINQWLKARIVTPEGQKIKPTSGTPQGGIISPILANIYLHYALDIWFEKQVKPKMKGRAMLIRYADDFVVAFQYQHDAKRFYKVLAKRLNKFNLAVAPEKTHLKRFSRFHPSGAPNKRFGFLGFEFYWDKDHKGEARLRRCTSRSKHKGMLNELYLWIKQNRHKRLNTSMVELRRKLIGIQNYFGLPDNSRSLGSLYNFVLHSLYKWLNRRSQRHSFNWKGFKDMLRYFQIEPLRVSKRAILVDWY